MSQSLKQDLKDTIEDLDSNIKLLKSAEEISLSDCKILLTQIFEVLKDLLQRFETVFTQVEKIMDIEGTTKKREKYEEKIIDEDVKRLYL